MIEVGNKVRVLKTTFTNNRDLSVGDIGVVTLIDHNWSKNWVVHAVFHKGGETLLDWFNENELEVVNDAT